FDFLGEDGAKAALVQPFESPLRDRLANAVRRLGAEVRRDQRLLNVVESRGIQSGAGGDAGQIVGDPIRGFLKPPAQAIKPTHAQTADKWSPWRPLMRAAPLSPREA